MKKKPAGPEPHQIIFAGSPAQVVLVDGTRVDVFVRELPARYHPLVFRNADRLAELIELCTYTSAGTGNPPAPLYPEVRAPHGYWPVAAGWADNVKAKSLHDLFDLAEKLNFTSAAATGKRQVAAKEWKAPLLLEAETTLLPFAEKLTHSLISSLTALSTAVPSTATPSSIKPSPGS